MQSDLTVGNDAITGTLTKLTSGQLVNDWGAGWFMGLKFTNLDPNATSVKVGLDPSQGSGLIEIIDDPDKLGVFKVDDQNLENQKFVVVSSNSDTSTTQEYSLAGLTLET